LAIIRINVNHEKVIAIIKEIKIADVFMIENILPKRKVHIQKPNFNI